MNEQLQALIDIVERERPRRIVVLTGAGISAESGIPTFRGAGGLWENHRAEDLATPGAFARDPHTVWRWYEWRRELIRGAEPNAAHLALARLEANGEVEVAIVTQNVDGLHRRAGSKKIVELHGNIMEARCLREGKTRDFSAAAETLPPHCECGALLRPNVVWFGEALPPGAWEAAVDLVAQSDLALVVGTSGVVYPAAGLIGLAEGRTVEINPEATRTTSNCEWVISMTAGQAVPPLVEAILGRRP
jgi:NAD-dependent deacetylase